MNNLNFNLDNSIDEDFFGSLNSKSSKLQQLFVEDALTPDDKQQSLKYQRPKANDLKNKEFKDLHNDKNVNSITLMAKVVTAYRQGELQGKVGLALIRNADDSHNIIMYKTKAYILTTLKLLKGHDLLYRQTKYWQFYGENAIYWSFSFDSLNDEEEFINKLTSEGLTYKEQKEVVENIDKLETFNNETHGIVIEEEIAGPLTVAAALKQSKNTLINRMAKMGRPLPTLPTFQQQTTTDFSDSSDTEVIKTPLTSTQKPSIAPRNNKLSSIKQQQLVPSMATYNIATPVSGAVYPVNPLESQYMQMLLTEQRTQGSELRMNMNKLENKIEKVLDKLDLYDRTDGKQKPEKDDEILELEEKLLFLKKENRKLKQNFQEFSAKKTEEDKLENILCGFKEYLSHFNIDYRKDIKTILQQLTDKLNESHKNVQTSQQQLLENEMKIKEQQKELALQTNKNLQLQNEVTAIKLMENDIKLKVEEKEIEIGNLKQELKDAHTKLQGLTEQHTNSHDDDVVIKSIMNNLYVDIANRLENSNFPQTDRILPLIATSIRQQTLKSMQEIKRKV